MTNRNNDFEFAGPVQITEEIKNDRNSAFKEFWIRFTANKGSVIGLIIVSLIVVLALVGPLMSGYSYDFQTINEQNLAPRIPGLEKIGLFDGSENIHTSTGDKKVNGYSQDGLVSTYYWFGSDTLGRDIFTRTWIGTRISLYISLVAVLIDILFGLSYGMISGYFGGKIDIIMQRIIEILNGIPSLVIMTLLIVILKPGIVTVTLAIIFTEWIGMSRIARAEVLRLKEQEFILASRTLGTGTMIIIFREILPNIFGPIITNMMFSIPTAIFSESFLSYIGLGIAPPMASLGSIISEAYKSFTIHPYMIVPPVTVLALLMLGFNLLADGLRDALDPKMKDRG